MLKKNTLLAIIALVSSFGAQAMDDVSSRALVPHALGKVAVMHRDKQFFVSDELASRPAQSAFVDKEMRGLSNEKLAKYLAANYIRVSKASPGLKAGASPLRNFTGF